MAWSPVAIGAAASRMLALLVAVALAVVVVPLHRGPAAAAADLPAGFHWGVATSGF